MPVIRRCMTRVSTAVEPQQQVLAAPSQPFDRAAADRGAELAGGTGRDQRSSSTSSDSIRVPFQLRLELARDGLDLGQLGHPRVLPVARVVPVSWRRRQSALARGWALK